RACLIVSTAGVWRQAHGGASKRIVQSGQHPINRRGVVLNRARSAGRRKCPDQRLIPVDVPVSESGMRKFDKAPQTAKVGEAFDALAISQWICTRLRHGARILQEQPYCGKDGTPAGPS